MTLNLTMSSQREELKPRITVFGVGGAGGNAVNNMIDKQLEGVEFVVANTDAQALQQSKAHSRIQMGLKVTEGLGAGARPAVGAAAAEETIEEIVDHLAGAHMCFITAGMGGGTGTGAAPIIAQAARELGVLTVGVVTKPFQFEGGKRMKQAEEGIEALQKVVDTLIIIPNQNLFRLANERTTFTEAFAMADDVLYQGVKGVTDLMVRPGLINLDFADVRAVMDEMGKAMMGTGEASGEDRAVQAAEKAIANPLLDEISLNGARGVLINITGGYDLTLFELDEAANIIREKVDPDANIIVGSTLDTSMEGAIRVSVVATGIDVSQANRAEPAVARRPMSQPLQPQMHQPAPQPAPITVQVTQPAYQPAPPPAYQQQPAPQYAPQAQARAPQQDPSLFDAPEEFAQQETEDEYDVPAPAYRPQQQAPRPSMGHEQAPEAFIAPRPPGTPSPEALQRLQAAVNKAPAQQPRPGMAAQPRAAAPAPKPAEARPRFGIGSLINRMAGGSGEGAAAPRQQPPVTSYDEEPDMNPEQERIEIPAFLRRQAN
ncbi:cell division protein FtsZ [Paragemmobacter straminiformis]|uniref:Cell division protein FtsZ n=1 Tax=Paragemmobacter straminiformis TaxID=2045119 RepID=A0A842IF11_9RHOB|nr:cell division protein FtsZ [Gemmobacter straminiformis]MBC2837298.1 cell division protein FtsZ [Gemmobacter straminiformis]